MSKHLYNYFVVTVWQFGKNQFAVVVRVPIGESFIDSGDVQYWTGEKWSRRDVDAQLFQPNTQAAPRAMRRLARKERSQ